MPPMEYSSHHQSAIVWVQTNTYDGYGVAKRENTGTEITCRWERGDFDPIEVDRQSVDIEAMLFASAKYPVGSRVWLGSYDDLPGTGTGSNNQPEEDVLRIVKVEVIPDLKARIIEYEYSLSKAMDTLGDQE